MVQQLEQRFEVLVMGCSDSFPFAAFNILKSTREDQIVGHDVASSFSINNANKSFI